MIDNLEEIERFSPYGGELILEEINGNDNKFETAENSVYTEKGLNRTMYSYIPKSGCPDAKQCQVLMVLRDENTKESAETLLVELKLKELAEEKHFILLFPNPQDSGWNYLESTEKDNDCAFLVRCFASLPKSKGTVAGFNGMIFYIGLTPSASAQLAVLSSKNPLDCSALMVGKFPEEFKIPNGENAFQTAWLYEDNTQLLEYLEKVNAPISIENKDSYCLYKNTKNDEIRIFTTNHGINAKEIELAWNHMFSETRRWRNDTYGTYQKRTNFSEKGFISHVKDTSLGVNDYYAHTWYEYIPERLRGTTEKVPLLFYFHGGNCIPLYGAEQSCWHDIADKEGFIVVYPKASTKKRWNVWNTEGEPSDFDFVFALIEHMKKIHPIDESRIYVSGFSMGSMMTNALCCAYSETFAAGAAYNAQNFGYLKNEKSTFSSLNMSLNITEEMNEISYTKKIADKKKENNDYRMPLIQASGLLDGLGEEGWPIKSKDSLWIQTINYWKAYNNIDVKEFEYNPTYETGLYGDENSYDYDDQRFIHHKWFTNDESHLPLYQFIVAKRMPHAVDLREIEIGWNFIKHYRRNSDGSLSYVEGDN